MTTRRTTLERNSTASIDPRSVGVRLAAAALACAATCLPAGTLAAHGGQYLGPTVGGSAPPGPPGRGPTPGMVQGGPLTGGRAELDVSSWRVWWELNHGRFVLP